MVKNRIQAVLERHPEVSGEFLETDLFGKQGMEYLMYIEISEPDKQIISDSIKFLKVLRGYIKKSDVIVDRLSKGDRRVEILQTVPGVGKFFSVLIATEIDEINRFPEAKKLCNYAGLVPSTYASGNKMFHGGITRSGNKFLRWALIEAVWPAIRKDSSLRYYYQKIKERKGANAAKVAVARRLFTIIYHMLKEDRGYRINYPAAPYVSIVKAR